MEDLIFDDLGVDDQSNAHYNKTQIYGLSGNDTLINDNFDEVLLIGGSGDDNLIIKGGNGTLSGGKGSDTFELIYSATSGISAVIEDLDPTSDKITVKFEGDTAPQLSSTVTSENDVIWRDGDGLLNITLKSVRDNDYFDGTADYEAWAVFAYTNFVRYQENLPWLTMSQGLTEGASIRVEEINEKGSLGVLTDHTRLDSVTSWLTVFDEIGKSYSNVAENLAGGPASPADVISEWLDSDEHREHILNPEYKKLGVAYKNDDPDPSNQRFYWVQWFAAGLSSTERETISAENLLTANMEVNTIPNLFVPLSENSDTYTNNAFGATIDALGGDDSITNQNINVSISGGAGNDLITSSGSYATINAGKGDDQISFSSDAKNNLIEYAEGDGNDTINGFHSGDTITISGDEFTPVTVDNDLVISVGADSITLVDSANLDNINILGTKSNLIILTNADNNYNNTLSPATIQALGGDDSIINNYWNIFVAGASIDGGEGNDTIGNYDDYTTIKGGAGNDFIVNWNNTSEVTISAGDGNDNVYNIGGDSVTIDAGAGDDFIANSLGANAIIEGGGGADTVDNRGDNATINLGDGEDSITSRGTGVLINGGASIDYIENHGTNSTLEGGAGDDSIISIVDSLTIDGGEGNDSIILSRNAQKKVIIYRDGDGADTVGGFNETDTLIVSGNYLLETSWDTGVENIAVKVGTGSILLLSAAGLSNINIVSLNDQSLDNNIPVTLTEGDDEYTNISDLVTILALGGDDSITNIGASGVIDLGTGDDSIFNIGKDISIDGGDGDDTISNSYDEFGWKSEKPESILPDNATLLGGAGDDRIYNFGASSIIDGGEDDDYISNNSYFTGDDEVDFYVITPDNTTILGGAGDDTISNDGANTTINAGDGDDSIYNDNYASLTAVNGDDGEDTINNRGSYVTINGGAGDDYIRNYSESSSIDAGAGSDTIENHGTIIRRGFMTINGGDGDDFIWNDNLSSLSILDGGSGDDEIDNYASDVTLIGGADNDYIFNGYNSSIGGDNVLIEGGEGNDSLYNSGGASSTITGGAGDDSIENYDGHYASIDAGAGDDYIYNDANDVTINGGEGDDEINLISNAQNNIIRYTAGDDTIYGFNGDDTLQIGDGSGTYSTIESGNSIIVNVGSGSINLKNIYANTDAININGDTIAFERKNVVLTNDDNEIEIYRDSISVIGSAGDDEISNYGENVSIDASAGDDYIYNNANNVTINGSEGDDYIYNDANNDTINGGEGYDYIYNRGDNVTINGGAGDDEINLSSTAENNIIQYAEGNDTIWELNADDTLIIGDGSGTYSTIESGNSIIVNVGSGSINLKNIYANADAININGDTIAFERKNVVLTNDDNEIEIYRDSISVIGSASDDEIYNYGENVSIDAGAGDDDISNYGASVTINGGAGDDDIVNYGENASIDASAGDDYIVNYANYVTFQYSVGGGDDYIEGFNETSTLSIAGISYASVISDYDLILNVGDNSITLVDAAYLSKLNIEGTEDNSKEEEPKEDQPKEEEPEGRVITLSEDRDTYENTVEGATILALGGDDFIANRSNNVLIDGSDGKDSLSTDNDSSNVSIDGGADNDLIYNTSSGSSISIEGGTGNDSIVNTGDIATINGGSGVDTVENYGDSVIVYGGADSDDIRNHYSFNVTINGDDGNDNIGNSGASVLINGGVGDDYILNSLSSSANFTDASVTMNGDDGNDNIYNYHGNSVTISGGAGNDSVRNNGDKVSINGGADNDTIRNWGADVSIIGGKGDDQISLLSGSQNNFIQYSSGDGDDTIWGLDADDTLQIGDGTGTYSTQVSGNDVIFKVGTGSMTLKEYRNRPKPIIIGESASSGGTGNGSGSGSGSGSGGGGGSTGGTSNSGSNSAASGGNSASGTSGGTTGNSGSNSGRGSDINTATTSTTTNQLWGNVDTSNAIFGGGDSDTFTGTDEADTFVSGKNQGSDTFRNISTKDTIYLNDATLSDLVSVKDVNGFIYLGFNTGNTLTIQSSELLSGAIALADGTAHRFNHMTRTWQ